MLYLSQLSEAQTAHQKMSGVNRHYSRSGSWYDETDGLLVDEEELVVQYKEDMEEMNVDEADILEVHSFHSNALASAINGR